MAVGNGLGMTVGVDVSAGGALKALETNITSITIDIPRGMQDITGVSMSGPARLHLLADYTVSLNGLFDDAADMSHDVFKTIAGVRTVTIVHSGQTLTGECLATGYNLSRAIGGELTYTTELQNADGAVAAWS